MNRSQEEARAAGLQLVQTPEGLALTDGAMQLIADFTHMIPRLKQGALHPVAFDATAGFGEDSLLLAAAGYTVEMFECNPVISALLADALARAASDSRLSEAAARMHLHVGDSIAGMAELVAAGTVPYAVYLDPMFPGRTKSASVKKKFQLLHHLEQPCADEAALLAAARATGARKIVIKRPVKGPLLADAKPSAQFKGKAVRYDVLAF